MSAMPPIPEPTPLSAPFWEGTRAGELRLQQCLDCAAWRWTPQILCRACHSERFAWRASSGRGKLYSFTIVHRPPLPAFAAPYVVGVVTLDEGPLMLTTIEGTSPDALVIDMPVKVAFRRLTDGITLYPFTAA
jgi:uncharacterized OB-fold protein